MNILKALDIEPDGIIGHSVGENACAYADGCLTLEQAVLSSYARGIASNEAETIKGMMAAIGTVFKIFYFFVLFGSTYFIPSLLQKWQGEVIIRLGTICPKALK